MCVGVNISGNSLDKLCQLRCDAYSAEQVLLNKQQISGGRAHPDCYPDTVVYSSLSW